MVMRFAVKIVNVCVFLFIALWMRMIVRMFVDMRMTVSIGTVRMCVIVGMWMGMIVLCHGQDSS